MRKLQCLLFVLKRSYICYYIFSMTVHLHLDIYIGPWSKGDESKIIFFFCVNVHGEHLTKALKYKVYYCSTKSSLIYWLSSTPKPNNKLK